MENYVGYAVASLLVVSVILLGTLIPGGPIENRDFSHISPLKLGAFNVFLTLLGIGSLVIAYFSIGGSKIALITATLCGISFFLVYALDLGKIFPLSPDKMPRTLFWIEVVGLILSIPLTFLSFIYMFTSKSGAGVNDIQLGTMIMILGVMVLLGIGIVIFATKAAMRKSPNKDNPSDTKKPCN
jgi:hypothetical protein